MKQQDIEQPTVIYYGGNNRPKRCTPGYTFPNGTLIFSDRHQWAAASKGKPDASVFRFMTRTGNLLYAILP